VPPKAPSGKLADPAGDAKDDENRRLALAELPHLAHRRGEIVGGDAVNLAVPKARPEMLVDRVSAAGLGRLAEVQDRTVRPLIRRLTEAKPRVADHDLASTAAREQFIAKHAGGHDPAGRPFANAGCPRRP